MGERIALQRLLQASNRLVGDFSADVDLELRPVVAEVLAEGGLLLTEVIESFGWNGVQFTRPVDVQKLISRLKALVYDGLEPMGRGTFASVYRVLSSNVSTSFEASKVCGNWPATHLSTGVHSNLPVLTITSAIGMLLLQEGEL